MSPRTFSAEEVGMPKKPEVSNQGHAAVHTGNSKFERQRQLISSFERIETKRQKSERQQDDRTKTERAAANRAWTAGVERITADLERLEAAYTEASDALQDVENLDVPLPSLYDVSPVVLQAGETGAVPAGLLRLQADLCNETSETINTQCGDLAVFRIRRRKIRMTWIVLGICAVAIGAQATSDQMAALEWVLVLMFPTALIALLYIWALDVNDPQ